MTREELEKEVLTLRREMELVSLRRQVTPHFLFNSISVAMSLVMQEPKKAVTFLRHLAHMYRYLLLYGNEYHVPVEKEMDMMQKFFSLMSVRHVGTINLHISPEAKRLKGHPLPPLSLQGIIENAIKHNTHTAEQPLHINITVETMEDGTERNGTDDEGTAMQALTISNNLMPLLSEAKSSKKGLQYVSRTMKLLCGHDIRIKNNGSHFVVQLPLV